MENETGESLQQQLHEELKAVEDLDPALPGMTEPHQHQAHRTTEVEKLTRHRQVCACGAHRDAGLTISGAWVGGEKTSTPWERAHLGAVQRAVEGQQDLLQLQPGAIQDLHRALLNDPPPGRSSRTSRRWPPSTGWRWEHRAGCWNGRKAREETRKPSRAKGRDRRKIAIPFAIPLQDA